MLINPTAPSLAAKSCQLAVFLVSLGLVTFNARLQFKSDVWQKNTRGGLIAHHTHMGKIEKGWMEFFPKGQQMILKSQTSVPSARFACKLLPFFDENSKFTGISVPRQYEKVFQGGKFT